MDERLDPPPSLPPPVSLSAAGAASCRLEQDGGVYSRRVPKVQLETVRFSDHEAPVLEAFSGPWDGGGHPEGLGGAG